jgi:trimethylamine:corrinoid methyltransferase-like protein
VALTDEEIEEVAKLIHASMRFAVPDNHYTRDWVERGNSLMQDEARRTARAVLARYGTPAIEPVPVSEAEL